MRNLFLALFCALFLVACNGNSFGRHHIALNDPKGIDTKYDSKTKELKIKDLHKPFILYFYSTTCVACAAQIPELNELLKKYPGKFEIYGIMGNSMGLDKDIEIAKEKGGKFLTISDPQSVHYFSTLVGGIYGTPATYIFDKNGNKVDRFLGLTPKSQIEKDLKKII